MSADELNATIAMKIIRADTKYQCADCGYETPTKQVMPLIDQYKSRDLNTSLSLVR